MNKLTYRLFIIFLFVLPAATFAGGHGYADKTMHAASTKDIVATAVSAGSFNTLVQAVQAADLVGTLKSDD